MLGVRVTESEVLKSYELGRRNLKQVRKKISRPLTYSEKILFSHITNQENDLQRGQGFLSLKPDRVAMQDATAQMALLQFMLAEKDQTSCPATVHCDHLIRAEKGESEDMRQALSEHGEVFDFLSSASSRYGLGFWGPGSGIIHQVILENYAYPGSLMIGTDSHTPNAGGLGSLAIGVGGADAADVMAGLDWEIKNPKIVGVHLTGALGGWTSAKDVILKLLQIMTVKGGTNKIIEYFGEGCSTISCTGKSTITNMGAEIGATSSIFPYDHRMKIYLEATQRKKVAELAEENQKNFRADDEVIQNPHSFFDELIEINLSTLKPHLSGPYSPDSVYPVDKIKEEALKQKWPTSLSACLIGSCTNSSYEDIGKAAHVARQAAQKGIKMKQPFLITPGSDQIKQTIERDGMLEDFSAVGATVLANACGPCIGQWKRKDYKKGEQNTIINSFNRNFRGRNDANPATLSFIGSPEMVVAIGLAGKLDFNPEESKLDGKLKLKAPVAEELPKEGFHLSSKGFTKPQGSQVEVRIKEKSERLQKLKAFKKWQAQDFNDLVLLSKVQGQCTTDHISPAGYWLRYRGHLDRISNNLLLTAQNAFQKTIGEGRHPLTQKLMPFNQIARDLKSQDQKWIIVGEENYGEGSSREHAAMTPRFLGCAMVIAKSFARIHETNLKKQGLIPLTFLDPKDYDKIEEADRFDLKDISNLAPGSIHQLTIRKQDKSTLQISLTHSLQPHQIRWFWEGSALNSLRREK